jgi:SsrA-binding protein
LLSLNQAELDPSTSLPILAQIFKRIKMEIATNRKARFNYEVIEKYEAGIELQGTEVKSCRNKAISIGEAFVAFEQGEAYMRESHISTYEQGNRNNHEPKRKRRLLLHKR